MEPKYVLRYFFDWGSGGSCLWPENAAARERFGYGADIEAFPLTEQTKEQADKLGKWHDTALNWDYPPDPGPWRQAECDRFNRAVREFFQTIQTELGPDFELVYHMKDEQEDPDLDEYLKDPRNFKRKA